MLRGFIWSMAMVFIVSSLTGCKLNLKGPETRGPGSTPETSNLRTVTVTSPAANTFVSLVNVSSFAISGTCKTESARVTLKNTTTQTTCKNGAWTLEGLDLSEMPEGNLSLTVQIDDETKSEDSRSFVKDTTPPEAARIQSPSDNSKLGKASLPTVTVSGSCSEEGGEIQLLGVSGTPVKCLGGQWSSAVTITSPQEGPLSVTATLTDAAGNRAQRDPARDSITLVIDTQVSVVSLQPWTNDTLGFYGGHIAGTCELGGTVFIEYDSGGTNFNVFGSEISVPCVYNPSETFSAQFQLKGPPGSRSFSVWQVDAAGNRSDKVTKSFQFRPEVDALLPLATNECPNIVTILDRILTTSSDGILVGNLGPMNQQNLNPSIPAKIAAFRAFETLLGFGLSQAVGGQLRYEKSFTAQHLKTQILPVITQTGCDIEVTPFGKASSRYKIIEVMSSTQRVDTDLFLIRKLLTLRKANTHDEPFQIVHKSYSGPNPWDPEGLDIPMGTQRYSLTLDCAGRSLVETHDLEGVISLNGESSVDPRWVASLYAIGQDPKWYEAHKKEACEKLVRYGGN